MSLSKAKSQFCQFLASLYPANLEESLTAALEQVTSIDMLSGDLYGDVDWDLPDIIGVPELGIQACIPGDYGCLCEVGSVVSEFFPSSVVDLLLFAICGVEAMISASILKVCVCALESTLSSSTTRIMEMESQLELKNSEFDASVAELEST